MTEPITRRMGRQWALVAMAGLLLYAGMCAPADKPAEIAETEAQGPTAEELAAAEEAARAEEQRQAEIAAAERELQEREARLAAAEQELAREREIEAERRRLAAERAATAERERQLAARQRELERQERELEERRLAESATAGDPGTGAAPAGEVRDTSERNEPWRRLPDGDQAEVVAEADPEPEDVAPAARPTSASLQPGKVLEVELQETLSSRTARVGDTFSGRLVHDLRNAEGVLVIPAGARVVGRVTEVEPLKRVGGQASLGIEFTEIVVPPAQRIGIRASFVELGADHRKDKRKIAAGAVAGAILGHILGGDGSKNVLIGAAVGAAAGTAVVARAKDRDAEIPAGERLALQLEEVVTVQIRYGQPAD